jgi:hypothetical protein
MIVFSFLIASGVNDLSAPLDSIVIIFSLSIFLKAARK